MVQLTEGGKTLKICITVNRRVTDRRTYILRDRRIDILRRHSPRYPYASSDKKTSMIAELRTTMQKIWNELPQKPDSGKGCLQLSQTNKAGGHIVHFI